MTGVTLTDQFPEDTISARVDAFASIDEFEAAYATVSDVETVAHLETDVT